MDAELQLRTIMEADRDYYREVRAQKSKQKPEDYKRVRRNADPLYRAAENAKRAERRKRQKHERERALA